MRDEDVDELLDHTAVLRRSGRADEALRLLAEAEARDGDDLLHRIAFRNERGLAQMDAGTYVAARETFADLVRLLESGAVDNPRLLAFVLDNLGYVDREIGDLGSALRHHQRAVELYRALDVPDELAHALLNLAIVQKDLGQLQQAEISIRETIVYAPPENEELAGFIGSVRGLIFEMLQEWESARREFIRALVMFRRMNDRENLAVTFHNLAVVEMERGRSETAMRFLRRSMRINEALRNIGGVANDLRRLALYVADAGVRPQAREMLLRACRDARRIGDRDLEVLCELDVARVAIQMRDPRETLKRTSRALRLGREITAPVVLYEILVARGIGWQESGRWAQAVRTYAIALESLERVRDGIVTEEMRLRYFIQPSDVHRALVEMSIRRGDARGAWLWAERTRGRELNRRIRRSTSLGSRAVPEDLRCREHELLRSLDAALQELERQATSDAARSVDHVNGELRALWDAMQTADPEYVAMRTGEPITFDDIRSDLVQWSKELRH